MKNRAKQTPKQTPTMVSVGGHERNDIVQATDNILRILECAAGATEKVEALRTLSLLAKAEPIHASITNCNFKLEA